MRDVPHMFPGLSEKRVIQARGEPNSRIDEIQHVPGVHVVCRQGTRARQVLLVLGDGCRVAIREIEGGLPWRVPPVACTRRAGA